MPLPFSCAQILNLTVLYVKLDTAPTLVTGCSGSSTAVLVSCVLLDSMRQRQADAMATVILAIDQACDAE